MLLQSPSFFLPSSFFMMQDSSRRFLVSLGGSLLVPGEIDTDFVRRFRELIVAHVEKGCSFILVTGGGQTARRYIKAAGAVADINDEDKDWIGIHATRMNAHFLRTVFREWAHPRINTNPHDLEDFYLAKESVLVAAGWRPGFSTDYVAVVLAKYLDFDSVINLSNTDGVYDKDPRKHPEAVRFDSLSWPDFQRLVGETWTPGMNAPFDPIASKLAMKEGKSVAVLDGSDIENLRKYMDGDEYIGTIIGG